MKWSKIIVTSKPKFYQTYDDKNVPSIKKTELMTKKNESKKSDILKTRPRYLYISKV